MSLLSFYIQIANALDEIEAPYMIVGAFAGLAFGINRTTHDIDILVNLDESQLDALATRFPPPRYYADPEMMRDSMQRSLMFNLIDTTGGLKADLVPLTREPDYAAAFARRIRQTFTDEQGQSFEAWCAQPTDIIIGKLRAWMEGRSDKHPNDIYQMLVFGWSEPQSPEIDLAEVERVAVELGMEVEALWHDLMARAMIDAQKLNKSRGINS